MEAKGSNEVSDDDERVEEPKFGMEFAIDKELSAYYERYYVKQYGFGVIIQRMKRKVDDIMKYVTIECMHSSKYQFGGVGLGRYQFFAKLVGLNLLVFILFSSRPWNCFSILLIVELVL